MAGVHFDSVVPRNPCLEMPVILAKDPFSLACISTTLLVGNTEMNSMECFNDTLLFLLKIH